MKAGGLENWANYITPPTRPRRRKLIRSVNPKNGIAETITRDLKAAAAKISVGISVVQASHSREIEAAFAALLRDKVDALVIGTDPFFYSRRSNLPRWRRAMLYPRSITCAGTPKPAA
jgi:hypothetical protein